MKRLSVLLVLLLLAGAAKNPSAVAEGTSTCPQGSSLEGQICIANKGTEEVPAWWPARLVRESGVQCQDGVAISIEFTRLDMGVNEMGVEPSALSANPSLGWCDGDTVWQAQNDGEPVSEGQACDGEIAAFYNTDFGFGVEDADRFGPEQVPCSGKWEELFP